MRDYEQHLELEELWCAVFDKEWETVDKERVLVHLYKCDKCRGIKDRERKSHHYPRQHDPFMYRVKF